VKCPKCGSPKAEFKIPAGYKKSPKDKKFIRKDFSAICRDCKYEFNATEFYDVIPEVTEKAPEKKTEFRMKSEEESK